MFHSALPPCLPTLPFLAISLSLSLYLSISRWLSVSSAVSQLHSRSVSVLFFWSRFLESLSFFWSTFLESQLQAAAGNSTHKGEARLSPPPPSTPISMYFRKLVIIDFSKAKTKQYQSKKSCNQHMISAVCVCVCMCTSMCVRESVCTCACVCAFACGCASHRARERVIHVFPPDDTHRHGHRYKRTLYQ